jgi:hypothetical protein
LICVFFLILVFVFFWYLKQSARVAGLRAHNLKKNLTWRNECIVWFNISFFQMSLIIVGDQV